MIDQAVWAKRHRTGIGGSDAPAVLGVSPWKSRLGLWAEKVGDTPPPETSERMVWGARLEKAILAGYAEDHGVKVTRVGFRRHAEIPIVIGHPDGMAGDRLLEVKTADRLSTDWGETGSDKVPEHYWVQVQHYLFLMGKAVADLVLLLRGNSLRTFTIPADRVFQASLIDQEQAFWRDHVLTGIPPDPDQSEDARRALSRLYPRESGEEIVASPAMGEVAISLLNAKATKKSVEEEIVGLENVLKAAMGSRSKMIGDGFAVSWSDVPGMISWKNVAAAYRNLILEVGESVGPVSMGEKIEKEIAAVLDGTVEGLYRGDPDRRFLIRRRGEE